METKIRAMTSFGNRAIATPVSVYADGVITFPVDAVRIVIGNSMYNGNMNGAFKLDMSNMQPVGGEEENGDASEAPAMRNNVKRELKNVEGGIKFGGLRFKKIDNTFMNLVEAELN